LKKLVSYTAFSLLIFFLGACKKEKKDTTSPLISISSPASGQTYNMFDTLLVTAHVSDETQLTSVVVSLNDLNNIPVQNTVPVTLQGKDFTFSIKYILTEYHLQSGFYNLSITANDGSNSHQAIRQVYINESPTLKTGYYMVGATLPKSIVKYDINMNPQGSITLNTGFNGMAYGGYNRQLFVNGNINQSYQTYNAQSNVDWSAPYGGGGLPQCMGVYSDGQKPYIAYYSGYVVSYSNTGTLSKSYINSNNSYYATYFTMGNTYNTGVYKEKFGTAGNKIICFGKNTGIAVNSNFTPCSVLGIFEHTSDELYILGNDAGNNAVVYLYSVSANIFTGPISSFPAGKLLSAVQIDPDYLIFASASGNIYGYRYSTGTTLSLANITAQKLFYHPKMKELTAASKNALYVYSVSGNYALNQQNMQVLADSIIGFEIITNK